MTIFIILYNMFSWLPGTVLFTRCAKLLVGRNWHVLLLLLPPPLLLLRIGKANRFHYK